MQLSMDAFLTPMETPNQAMQLTASRTAFRSMTFAIYPLIANVASNGARGR